MPEPSSDSTGGTAEKPAKRSLLQKYDIPLQNLDFEYVRKCCDAREIERIYAILKSGQEGHYPDLLLCTAERLAQLKPDSKALRTEVPMMRPATVPDSEWQMLSADLENHLKAIHSRGDQIRSSSNPFPVDLPPIRSSNPTAAGSKPTRAKSSRIKSCDYAEWDKYDADVELTKIDLSSEQAREAAALDEKRRQARPIDGIVDEANSSVSAIEFNAIEQDEIGERFRIQGNDHYRAGDYAEAVVEYTRSLAAKRTAVGFANRAMAYLKMNDNNRAIRDCDECLALDASNVKAYLRKAQALLNEKRNSEAFAVYTILLGYDAANPVAVNAMRKLREQMPDKPPENAHRMKITSNTNVKTVEKSSTKEQIIQPKTHSPKNDLAELIIPKRIVPSKLARMATSMGGQQDNKNRPSIGQKLAPKTDRKPANAEREPMRMRIPTGHKTEYKNGVIIEEL